MLAVSPFPTLRVVGTFSVLAGNSYFDPHITIMLHFSNFDQHSQVFIVQPSTQRETV